MIKENVKSAVGSRTFISLVLGFALLPICFFGCAHPKEDFDGEFAKLSDAWAGDVGRRAATTEKLDWRTASRKVVEENRSLRRARENVRRAEKGVPQVVRDLIPAPDFSLRVTDTFDNVERFGQDGVSLNVGAFIRLSGLFYLPRDLYTARLNLLGQQVAYRIAKRERLVTLWSAFQLKQLLVERRERLGRLAEIVERLPVSASGDWRRQLADAHEQLFQAEASLQSELAELLNTSSDVRLTADSAPDYSVPNGSELEARLREESLSREVATIEILRAYAAIDGAKLERWPQPNFYVYGGDFLDYRNNETETFSWDSMFGTAGTYYRVDVSGRRALRVEEAEFNAKLAEERVELEQAALLQKIRVQLQELKQLDDRLERLERRRDLTIRLLNGSTPQLLLRRMQELYGIEQERASYKETRIQLAAFFLFHDEAFWSQLSF